MPLSPDATLADVSLTNPKKYYPPLLKCLTDCAAQSGSAYARIGTDGGGTTPYYLITTDEDGQDVFGAFDYGHKFKPAPGSIHWSTKAMGMHEVIALAAPFIAK